MLRMSNWERFLLAIIAIFMILALLVVCLAAKNNISSEIVKMAEGTMYLGASLLFMWFLVLMWLSVLYKRKVFPVEIDYGLSFKEIVGYGKYSRSDCGLTEKDFPIQGEGKLKRNLLLIDFPIQHWFRWIFPLNKKVILKQLQRQNLIPAKIEDLIFFSALYPEECKKFDIAALGHNKVCYLTPYTCTGICGLVDWGVFEWDPRGRNKNLRFLAYRKI